MCLWWNSGAQLTIRAPCIVTVQPLIVRIGGTACASGSAAVVWWDISSSSSVISFVRRAQPDAVRVGAPPTLGARQGHAVVAVLESPGCVPTGTPRVGRSCSYDVPKRTGKICAPATSWRVPLGPVGHPCRPRIASRRRKRHELALAVVDCRGTGVPTSPALVVQVAHGKQFVNGQSVADRKQKAV